MKFLKTNHRINNSNDVLTQVDTTIKSASSHN